MPILSYSASAFQMKSNTHPMNFSDYPAFQSAAIEQIFTMQYISPTQLHWPELDVDIEIDALDEPEKYPLLWKD